MSPAPFDVPPEKITASASQPARERVAERRIVVGNDAEMDRLASELGDGSADDRGVRVVHGCPAARVSRRHDLVAGREDRHARPPIDVHLRDARAPR